MYVLYNAGESQLSMGVASLDMLVMEALEPQDGNGNIKKRDAVRGWWRCRCQGEKLEEEAASTCP